MHLDQGRSLQLDVKDQNLQSRIILSTEFDGNYFTFVFTDVENRSVVVNQQYTDTRNAEARISIVAPQYKGALPGNLKFEFEEKGVSIESIYARCREPDARAIRNAFAEIGYAGLLKVPDALIASVLMDSFKADADIQWKFDQFVCDLDDDDFIKRHRAIDGIIALGYPGGICAQQYFRTGLSPEVRANLEEIISVFPNATPEQRRLLLHDNAFLLESLATADEKLLKLVVPRLRENKIYFTAEMLRDYPTRVFNLRREYSRLLADRNR